ncbi:hypothetical protein [Streptomyces sp. NPDC058657]|uniref:hypothetical protein n=1 Tax=unclassified Streptomyces TaxID=2593676 RepID=UPI0036622F9C
MARPANNESTDRTEHQGQHPDTRTALGAIAELANLLCDHLADGQWRTADHIRRLAETALSPNTPNGAP